jgi:hypothetical protein
MGTSKEPFVNSLGMDKKIKIHHKPPKTQKKITKFP